MVQNSSEKEVEEFGKIHSVIKLLHSWTSFLNIVTFPCSKPIFSLVICGSKQIPE